MSYNIGNIIKLESEYWIIYNITNGIMEIANNTSIRKEKVGNGVIVNRVSPTDTLSIILKDIGKLIHREKTSYVYFNAIGKQVVKLCF